MVSFFVICGNIKPSPFTSVLIAADSKTIWNPEDLIQKYPACSLDPNPVTKLHM